MSGSLFIITAASGTGKTSLVKQLLATTEKLAVSVSHTTRPPRVGEVDKKDYYFIAKQDFLEDIKSGQFLEHALVFGHYYGTSKANVDKQLAAGWDVILEIDWQGALKVKDIYADVKMIFILPPSLNSLKQRLTARAQDSDEVIHARLAGAVKEMSQFVHFDYLIINDKFEVALSELKSIIIADRQTRIRQQQRHAHTIDALLNGML